MLDMTEGDIRRCADTIIACGGPPDAQRILREALASFTTPPDIDAFEEKCRELGLWFQDKKDA